MIPNKGARLRLDLLLWVRVSDERTGTPRGIPPYTFSALSSAILLSTRIYPKREVSSGFRDCLDLAVWRLGV